MSIGLDKNINIAYNVSNTKEGGKIMIDLKVKFKCGCEGIEKIHDDGKGNETFKKLAHRMICKDCFDAQAEKATEILSVEADFKEDQ